MVDACSRATILDYLLKLRDDEHMTIIFITHDIGLAYYVSDSVYIMEHGQVRRVRSGGRCNHPPQGGLHQAPD